VAPAYVEADPGARAQFPGVAVHLSMCPACRTEHDGVLASIDHGERLT